MSYAKYKAFVVAAEQQSLTKAASLLDYTQSGVSHMIASLEREIGLPLLIRGRNGAELTPEGGQLLPYIKRLIDAEEDIHAMSGSLRGVQAGSLRIGTISSVAMSYLPGLLHKFQQSYPHIELLVRNGSYADVENALMENRVDCSFVTLSSSKDFFITPLTRDRLLAIVHSESPLAMQSYITPKELQNEPFIVPAEGGHYDIGKMFSAAGITLRTRMDMQDDYAAIAMVREGLGITILPELLAKSLPSDGVRAIPILNSEREIGIAVKKSRYQAPAVRAFVDFVRETMSDHKACAAADI